MHIFETLGIFAAVVTIVGFIWSLKRDITRKFDSLHEDMKAQIQRIDLQSQRTDKLYSMFVDLLTKMQK